MAKKNELVEAASTDLTTTGPTDMASLLTGGDDLVATERPKSLGNDLTGTEDIGADDVRLPRLAIAQGLSPQMTPGNAQHIKGLQLFEMFNDLTNEVYGNGPIKFVPVRRDVRRIEFRPRREGGGVLDLNVPAHDPRLDWTEEDGERIPPRATTFIEFVVLLLRPGKMPEPIVLSIKGTNKYNRRASDQLTTFIKMRNAAIYAGIYEISTSTAQNDNGTFGIPVIKNAGFINRDIPSGKALHDFAAQFHESLKGKEIIVDREPGSDDFDGPGMDAAAGVGGSAASM